MLVPAGIPTSFTAVFNNPTPAFVAMSVYDNSGANPVLLLSPVQMGHVNDNVYAGKTTLSPGNYVVFMAVYTDATFVTLDPSFKTAEQALSVSAAYLASPANGAIGKVSCEGDNSQSPNTFKIFRGDNKTMKLLVFDLDNNGLPVNLTGCTEIDLTLTNADGTPAHFLLSTGKVSLVQPPILGGFSADIDSDASALLKVGEYQDVNATFTVPGEIFSVRFYGALSVFEIQ